MVQITIRKPSDKPIGNLRVSEKVFAKVEALAKKNEVSRQQVIREILEGVIDKVEV